MNQTTSKGTAVVTGASSGIGVAYAEQLIQRGYDLLLVARRKERLDVLAERLTQTSHRQVSTLVADLGNPTDLAQLEHILESRDDISLLVNNAGAGAIGPILEVSVEALDDLLKVNVTALTRLTHAALQGFNKRRHGTVVNIGSVIAFKSANTAAAYAGSKAYVLSFSRSLQSQLKDSGIAVQVVLPGPVRTDFFSASGVSTSIFPEHLFATAEEVVEAALRGLDRGELVCIPSLADVRSWHDFDAAQRTLGEVVSDGHPSARYAAP
jgi:uncharacterized protein